MGAGCLGHVDPLPPTPPNRPKTSRRTSRPASPSHLNDHMDGGMMALFTVPRRAAPPQPKLTGKVRGRP